MKQKFEPPVPIDTEAEARRHALETAVFAAELGVVPEIDLHGEPVHLAISHLEEFVHHEVINGTEVVKIIHGRGNGILQKAVRSWLTEQNKIVLYYRDASHQLQQGAVTFAALERIKK